MRMIFLCLCLWLALPLFSQSTYRQLLPPHHDYNYFAHQDRDGFYWISSSKGWYRFDGREYVRHPVPEATTGPGYDQGVQSPLVEDGTGKYWFTGYDGLHQLDSQTGEIVSRRLTYGGRELSTDYQLLYRNTRTGQLLLTLEDHLYTFEPVTEALIQLPPVVRAKRFGIDTFPDGTPRLIVGGLFMAGDGIEVLHRPSPTAPWQFTRYEHVAGQSLGTTADITFIGAGRCLAATRTGLRLLELNTDESGTLGITQQKIGPDTPVIASRYDPIAGKTHVLYRSGELVEHNYNLGVVRSARVSPRCHALSGIIDGRPWIGVRGSGIWYPDPETRSDGLRNPLLPEGKTPHSLVTQANGRVSLLTTEGTVYRYEPANEEGWRFNYQLPVPVADSLTQLVTHRNENFLLERRKLFHFPTDGVPSVNSVQLAPTPLRHTALHESGSLLLLDGQTIRQLDFPPLSLRIPGAVQEYQNYEFDYLAYLGNNELVTAWNSQELWFYDWNGVSVTFNRSVVIGSDIHSVVRDPASGAYFIGTEQGLYQLSGNDQLALTDHHLNQQRTVFRDLFHHCSGWVLGRTAKGLTGYHASTRQLRYFPTPGGRSLNTNRPFQFRELPDGEVLLLNDRELYAFHPDTLLRQPAAPITPYVSAVYVNGLPRPELLNGIDAGIDLPYNKNNVELRLASLGLPGRTEEWIEVTLSGARRQREYLIPGSILKLPDLAPGTYDYTLRSIDATGAGGHTVGGTITVSRPFWQSPLFLASVVLSLLGLGYGLAYRRARRKLRTAQIALDRQRAIGRERDRIAAELHDDLGGDLASMVYLLDGHRYLTEQGQASVLDTDRLQDLAQDSMRNMREMIWVLDEGQATPGNLAKQLLALARKSAELGNISMQVDFPREYPDWQLTSVQKRNITLIAKEALQNIRKHAGATAFHFRLQLTEDAILLEISDNGRGIPAASTTDTPLNSGYGMKNMRQRATEIGGVLRVTPTLPTGTKISLTLPVTRPDNSPS